jgi:hypothetical protein
MFRCILTVAFFAASLTTAASSEIKGPDAGNWTVGDCILAQFAMEFTVHFNNSDVNQTMVMTNAFVCC